MGFLTKTAKMTNLFLTNKTKVLRLKPRETMKDDEKGGCHAGEGMVYQRQRFLFPESKCKLLSIFVPKYGECTTQPVRHKQEHPTHLKKL